MVPRETFSPWKNMCVPRGTEKLTLTCGEKTSELIRVKIIKP